MMLLATLPVNYRRRLPISDLLPGQYRTYFDEYTVGVQPSDWTLRWAATFPCTVVELSGTIRGKALLMDAGTEGRNLLSWDAIDSDADRGNVEVLLHARFVGEVLSDKNNSEILALTRGANASEASATGYRHGMRPRVSGGQAEFGKYSAGSFSSFGSPDTSIAYGVNSFYWLRVKVEGSAHYLKQWEGAYEDEPTGWGITASDSTITDPGWVGVFRNASSRTAIDFFSVGTGGKSAPGPSTVDITPLSTTGISATSDFDSGDSV